jgi:hypothetical protein
MTFRRREIQTREQRIAERQDRLAVLLRAPRRTANYSGTTSGEVVAKCERVKPGKVTPTKAEREWMDWIVAYGCVACHMDGFGRRPAAVHHVLRGGQRIGHLFTLPLCDPGHHQNGTAGLVSRHPWKARFEAKYGTEEELLARLRKLYEGERNAKS